MNFESVKIEPVGRVARVTISMFYPNMEEALNDVQLLQLTNLDQLRAEYESALAKPKPTKWQRFVSTLAWLWKKLSAGGTAVVTRLRQTMRRVNYTGVV